ncbi:MAG: response regulator [Planctomycetes bacterium]|nr:response regulator [Planctomycetota bacterium]
MKRPSAFSRPKIAVCDDDINILSTLRKILKKIGFEVFCTRNEEELFEILAEESINVVIVDYNLKPATFMNETRTEVMQKSKNGLEIISTIREKWNNQRLKLVLTTSKSNATIQDVQNAGGNDILYKPYYSFNELADFLLGLTEQI